MRTRSRPERTRRGIGDGSTRAELVDAQPVECVSPRLCSIGSNPGVRRRPYTGLELRDGRVRRVILGVATP